MKFVFYPRLIAGILGLAILTPLTALGSSISNVSRTHGSFGSTAPLGSGFTGFATRIPNFLGGNSDYGIATDENDERRVAMNTIPNAFDWAFWDPSGLGDDFDFGDGNAFSYHDGHQIQWESKFSTPSADQVSPPNGTISPANLLSLGAQWFLTTGTEVAQSGQGDFRVSNSGKPGLRIDPTAAGGVVDGQKFHLDMTIPVGDFRVSLFMTDKQFNGLTTLNLPGVTEVALGNIAGASDDDHVLQFDVTNDSGSAQVLEFDWGDLDGTLSDVDFRFSAAVIQSLPIPEPTTLALGLAGLALCGLRRRIK